MEKQSLARTRQFTTNHYEEAVMLRGLGQHDRAIINYSKAIQLQPTFAEAYYERGLVYQQIGCYKEAKLDFIRYLDLNPEADNRDKVLLMLADGRSH